MEVKGDSEDFIPTYSSLDKNDQISKDVDKIIRDLKKDKKVGIHLKQSKIPNYYVRKHDYNAYFKVNLPENWRLIYGIISINREKHALIMELFNHDNYSKRFGFKKK